MIHVVGSDRCTLCPVVLDCRYIVHQCDTTVFSAVNDLRIGGISGMVLSSNSESSKSTA